jgi:hypothetical protein
MLLGTRHIECPVTRHLRSVCDGILLINAIVAVDPFPLGSNLNLERVPVLRLAVRTNGRPHPLHIGRPLSRHVVRRVL